jgi:hypothetical protein
MDETYEDQEPDEEILQTPIRSGKVYSSRASREAQQDRTRPTIELIWTKDYSNVNKIAERDHLMDKNWHEWKDRMKRVFINCVITGYISSTVQWPDDNTDPIGATNWDRNDTWAQQIVMQNVTSSQMNHVGSKTSAEAMYSALTVTHENKAHQTVNHIQCLLYETKIQEADDLLKHLDTLKSYCDHMNKFPNTDFHIADTRFKAIVSASLPPSWQTYVEPYNGNANDPNDLDPKRKMSSDSFIGLLWEEYKIRMNRSNNRNINSANVNLVNTQKNNGTRKSLEDRITDHKASIKPYCEHCKRPGHWSSKCHKFAGNKCRNCGKIGHQEKDCWGKKKDKEKRKGGNGGGSKKGTEESNVGMEEISFLVNEELYNFDTYDACNLYGNDERLSWYDWLADTATTSHVMHQREAFTTYAPMGNGSVMGVGGKEAKIAGRRTVELISTCNGHKYLLRLENVLHVPGTRNNLISLGRWDAADRRYIGGKGRITLITKDKKQIAQGRKVSNHLYKMNITI